MARKKLTPARLVPPGRILRRELDARGWTQKEFSDMIDLSEKAISAIVNGKKQIMPETALKFAAALGGSAEFWLNLEGNYRLRLAQREINEGTLEGIRARSAARTEQESTSLKEIQGSEVREEDATTRDLPIESALEAELVQAARREGVSLETYVTSLLREKLDRGAETLARNEIEAQHLGEEFFVKVMHARLNQEIRETTEATTTGGSYVGERQHQRLKERPNIRYRHGKPKAK